MPSGARAHPREGLSATATMTAFVVDPPTLPLATHTPKVQSFHAETSTRAGGSLKNIPFITTNNLDNYPEAADKISLAQENKQDLIFKWDVTEFLAVHQSHC